MSTNEIKLNEMYPTVLKFFSTEIQHKNEYYNVLELIIDNTQCYVCYNDFLETVCIDRVKIPIDDDYFDIMLDNNEYIIENRKWYMKVPIASLNLFLRANEETRFQIQISLDGSFWGILCLMEDIFKKLQTEYGDYFLK